MFIVCHYCTTSITIAPDDSKLLCSYLNTNIEYLIYALNNNINIIVEHSVFSSIENVINNNKIKCIFNRAIN